MARVLDRRAFRFGRGRQRRPLPDRAVRAFMIGLARVLAGGTVHWQGAHPALHQRVYFAQHTSHLDYLVIWASLPKELRERTRPVAARDYWAKSRTRRYLARAFDAVLIERTSPPDESNGYRAAVRAREAVMRMVEGMGEAYSLVLFPEGTRGSGDTIKEFRAGLYHIYRARPDLEFVPVRVENVNRILPKGAYVPIPRASRVTFGPPFRVGPGERRDAFMERARQALENLAREPHQRA